MYVCMHSFLFLLKTVLDLILCRLSYFKKISSHVSFTVIAEWCFMIYGVCFLHHRVHKVKPEASLAINRRRLTIFQTFSVD